MRVTTPQYLVLTGILHPDNRFEYRASYLTDNPDVYRGNLMSPLIAELLDDKGELLLRQPLSATAFCLDGETSRELRVSGALPFPANTRNVRLVREGARVFDLHLSDRLPELQITWRPPGLVEGKQVVTWETRHAENLPVTCFVRYSQDGKRWRRVAASTSRSEVTIDFDELPGGEECRIAVVASAGAHTTSAESSLFAVPVKPCRAMIFAPKDGATLAAGQAVALRGQGFYLEENRPETRALLWKSSRDGELGQGMAVDAPGLSPGEHEITLTVAQGRRAGTAIIKVYVQGIPDEHEGAPASSS